MQHNGSEKGENVKMRQSEFSALSNTDRWQLLIDTGVIEVIADDAVLRKTETEDEPYEDWSKTEVLAEVEARSSTGQTTIEPSSWSARTSKADLIAMLRADDDESQRS
jgi:hypothetical protein